MKNRKLLITLTSLFFIQTAWAGSFERRWGANSHIAQLPLFFQTQIYNDGKTKKIKKLAKENKKKITIINSSKQYASNDSYASNSQQTPAILAKKTKNKQNAIERQKAKLLNKITDLEKKEFELTQVKNGNIALVS